MQNPISFFVPNPLRNLKHLHWKFISSGWLISKPSTFTSYFSFFLIFFLFVSKIFIGKFYFKEKKTS
ncbi:hypothetical protein XENTR_v10024354 [Xenopus tropicalis]|nr:hypothetical protein XENTR_v10024354 [Xenopus tropicalis]